MLRIEVDSDGPKRVVHLIGRLRAEHIDELSKQLEARPRETALDLEQVTLVDGDVVRFLGACEDQGILLLHCAPYVREWVKRERDEREGKECPRCGK